MDLRRNLFHNIVMAGGTTLMGGFGDRLLSEVRAKAKDVRVRIVAPSERQQLAWSGGSILASLSSFRDLVVQRREWEEEGDRIWASRGL